MLLGFLALGGLLVAGVAIASRQSSDGVAPGVAEPAGASFTAAMAVVFAHEGGWVDNPNDPGGETNMGITMRRLKEEGTQPRDVGLADFSPGSLKKLTRATATDLYWKWFWGRYDYSRLYDQRVATKVFDVAVNTGAYRAHVLAQEAVNDVAPPIKVDGQFGPLTVAAINAIDPHVYVGALAKQQSDFYKRLIAQKPVLAEFGRNWERRSQWGVS